MEGGSEQNATKTLRKEWPPLIGSRFKNIHVQILPSIRYKKQPQRFKQEQQCIVKFRTKTETNRWIMRMITRKFRRLIAPLSRFDHNPGRFPQTINSYSYPAAGSIRQGFTIVIQTYPVFPRDYSPFSPSTIHHGCPIDWRRAKLTKAGNSLLTSVFQRLHTTDPEKPQFLPFFTRFQFQCSKEVLSGTEALVGGGKWRVIEPSLLCIIFVHLRKTMVFARDKWIGAAGERAPQVMVSSPEWLDKYSQF